MKPFAIVSVILPTVLPACGHDSWESVCNGAGGSVEERLEEATDLPAVVAIYGQDPEGVRWGFCSGVLVGPAAVLTAAHCLHDRSEWTFDVYFVPDFARDRSEVVPVAVDGWRVHPHWAPDGHGQFDLAILELTITAPVSPLPWTPDMPSDGIDGQYSFVGYGGARGDVTNCLRVSNDASDVELEDSPTRIRAFVHPDIYYGDSGGPLLLDTGMGPTVLGVLAESTFIGSEVAFGSLTYFAKLRDEPWFRTAASSEPVVLSDR